MFAELKLISSHGDGRSMKLRPGRWIVGRSHRCDIRVSLPSVAPRHAQLAVSDIGVSIQQLTDGFPVLLNEQPIDGVRELALGDVLSIGTARFAIAPAADTPPSVAATNAANVEIKPPGQRRDPPARREAPRSETPRSARAADA